MPTPDNTPTVSPCDLCCETTLVLASATLIHGPYLQSNGFGELLLILSLRIIAIINYF